MPAGYSGTPLARKLGIKPRHTIGLISAPDHAEEILAPLPDGVILRRRAQGRFDVMVFCCRRERDLARRFSGLAAKLVANGGLWIGWPKKTSGLATDLSFDVVQRIGLEAGLVDNKVCAIDETWSGLRFVIRLRDR